MNSSQINQHANAAAQLGLLALKTNADKSVSTGSLGQAARNAKEKKMADAHDALRGLGSRATVAKPVVAAAAKPVVPTLQDYKPSAPSANDVVIHVGNRVIRLNVE